MNMREHNYFFKGMNVKMNKFLKEWNDDEEKRDKTVMTFNQMKETKEEVLDSLSLAVDRNGKIEETLIKG